MRSQLFVLSVMVSYLAAGVAWPVGATEVNPPSDSSALRAKAAWLENDLVDKHSLDGLYVSIVPASAPGTKLQHTVMSLETSFTRAFGRGVILPGLDISMPLRAIRRCDGMAGEFYVLSLFSKK